MRIFLIYIVLFTTLCTTVKAQKYHKTYGIKGYNYGVRIIPIDENELLLVGNSTGPYGNSDIYLASIDTLGKLLHDTIIGSAEIDQINDVLKLPNGNLLFVGYTNNSTDGNYDMLVLCTNISGEVIWRKNFGKQYWDFGRKAAITSDSAIIVVGETYTETQYNDMYFVKLNYDGDTLWTRTVGTPGQDAAYNVLPMSNNTFYVCGYTNSSQYGKTNAALVLLDSLGKLKWSRNYGNSQNDCFNDIYLTQGGNLIMVGSTNITDTITNGFIQKTDKNGNVLIAYNLSNNTEYNLIKKYSDNKILCVGYTIYLGFGRKDIMITELDTSLNYIKGPTAGHFYNETVADVYIDKNQNTYVLGTTDSWGIYHSNMYFLKLDQTLSVAQGNPENILTIKQPTIDTQTNFQLTFLSNNQIQFTQSEISPNTQICIYNLQGQKISQTQIKQLTENIQLPLLPNALYTISVTQNNIQQYSSLFLSR